MYNDQPIEKGQSYNIFRTHTDDSDLVRQYELDPAVAYTPQINSAIVNAQHRLTYNQLVKDGVSETKAMKAANSERSKAHQRVSRDLKKFKERGE